MKRFGDPVPTVCGVCKREAGAGAAGSIENFKGGAPRPRLWVCMNPECWRVAEMVLKMPLAELSGLEGWSLADAGEAAGAYLESLGKSDLGDLSPIEWTRFLKTILTTYESQMRARLNARLGKNAA